jgi:hypothetical protein
VVWADVRKGPVVSFGSIGEIANSSPYHVVVFEAFLTKREGKSVWVLFRGFRAFGRRDAGLSKSKMNGIKGPKTCQLPELFREQLFRTQARRRSSGQRSSK